MRVEEKYIYLNDEENISNLLLIGRGCHGAVYKDDHIAYKFFKWEGMNSDDFDLKMYKYFQNLKLADFSFPEKLIFIGNRFSGYTMPLFKGKDLNQKSFDGKFSTLKEYMAKGEKSIRPLAEYKIKADDLNASNVIMLDNFKFIDIDLYTYNKSFSKQECLENNLLNLNYLCCDIVYDGLSPCDLKTSLLINSWMDNIENNQASYSEYIDIVQQNLSDIAGKEVNTLKEGAKVLRKNISGY